MFNIQFKLACLLLNIKRFVELRNIQSNPTYEQWILDKFDYLYDDQVVKDDEFIYNPSLRSLNDGAEQMLMLQQQFIEMNVADTQSHGLDAMEDDQTYEIDRIIDHGHDDNGDPIYRIKWKGFGYKKATWEPVKNFNQHDVIVEYWRKLERNKDFDEAKQGDHC